MKIDIHVHTKKTKQGDATTRSIDSKRFAETITATDVKILAITNHNHFDLVQYNDFKREIGPGIQIWPGVELDIVEDKRRAHLIVIVSPLNAEKLHAIVNNLVGGSTADNFKTTIDDVLTNFDSINPVYIAHYRQKKPDLPDGSIERLIAGTSHKCRVLKEVSNSISAGIYISHGHGSIYGSDVQDWNSYESISQDLPELRLPVDSFEHFCLLLEKDAATINTLLERKTTESLALQPFEDKTKLTLKVYNDINILFGSKGTGKSKILHAIAKHYKAKGIAAGVFESGSEKLDALYDINGKDLSIDFKDHGIDYCTKEISAIKSACESDVTALSSYHQFFSSALSNKNAQRIKIKDFQPENLPSFEREFTGSNNSHKKVAEFLEFVRTDKVLADNVSKDKIDTLDAIVKSVLLDLAGTKERSFIKYRSIHMFNGLIAKIKSEIARKTGTPQKPSATGFQNFALNRIAIEINARKVISNLQTKINLPSEYVGSLGVKGDLYCRTEVILQDGSQIDGKLSSISKVTKNPQKEFARKINEIAANIFTIQLFEKISELNSIENSEMITSIHELALFKRYFVINDSLYAPSNGEVSMLLLHKELSVEKDIYILDEPEKSLGNDYINDVIVPMIKDKAKMGKKVFISTHDANIAVRTLPYNSIYRRHKNDGNDTFVGNPFANNLTNISNPADVLNWKNISMKTLEGGEEAFGERGRIYGNV